MLMKGGLLDLEPGWEVGEGLGGDIARRLAGENATGTPLHARAGVPEKLCVVRLRDSSILRLVYLACCVPTSQTRRSVSLALLRLPASPRLATPRRLPLPVRQTVAKEPR